MRRAGIALLVACAVVALGSVAGGLVRAASRAAYDRFGSPDADETPVPSHFSYLPLVAKNASPEPTWVTVVDEDFEDSPGNAWKFYDQGQQGLYYWGSRDCRSHSPTHSAWAVGGGTLGQTLACGSDYPDNIDSWMVYGPFSLADATAAKLSFWLWLDVSDEWPNDKFYMYASSDGASYEGDYLTFQPGGWTPLTFDLDNDLTGVNMLGRPQVWIALRFTSNGAVHFPEGAYVDDVVIRKCVGGICPPASGLAPAPGFGPAVRFPAALPATRSSQLYGSGR